MRDVTIKTSDKARFHASSEGSLMRESAYYTIKEPDGNRAFLSDMLYELEGKRVHIVIFVED